MVLFISSSQNSYLKVSLTSTSLIPSYLSKVISLKAIRACIIIYLVISFTRDSIIL